MSARLLSVTFDAHDPEGVARFWSRVLGRQLVAEGSARRIPADGDQVGIRFVESDVEKAGPNRIHLHLTSASPAGQQDTVANALRLGARHLDVGQLPEEGHVVLSDPGDNEFCVIEPGNSFLAGCGFLGEVACEGSREVGLFWSRVLGWPLVWDQDEETAIQLPQGGTKVAWGGSPIPPKVGTNRQRLELAPGDDGHAAEVDRLVAMGARRLVVAEDGDEVLADPDGNEFSVKTS